MSFEFKKLNLVEYISNEDLRLLFLIDRLPCATYDKKELKRVQFM